MKQYMISVAVIIMVMLIALATPLYAQQPQPPQLPNPYEAISSRYIDVTARRPGTLRVDWYSLVQKYLDRGYFIEAEPFQAGQFWYVVVSKWVSVAPAVVMVPNPTYGGATYCQMYPWAQTCYNPYQ
jgi:hypothetical protein